MGTLDRSRSSLATVVGWLLVIIIGWIVLSFVWGAVRWIFKAVIWLVIIGVLLWAYLALKAPRDDD